MFTLLHRTRELFYALYTNPQTFNPEICQYWVSHTFSLVRVVEIESGQMMFSDLYPNTDNFRANTIRKRISHLVQNAPNHHTAEIARAFHEFIMNVRWSRPGAPINLMDVLPGFIRLVYQDREPGTITDPNFLIEFNVDGGTDTIIPPVHVPTPPPIPFGIVNSNGARLLATLIDMGMPPPALLRNRNQYDVLSLPERVVSRPVPIPVPASDVRIEMTEFLRLESEPESRQEQTEQEEDEHQEEDEQDQVPHSREENMILSDDHEREQEVNDDELDALFENIV
jgi:hypothetical protein